jgi:AcrR family transcriptional regulator
MLSIAMEQRLDGRRSEARGSGRARLLDAAARVFAARGYRAASVDDIVAEAGVTKGALYWSFDSKQALFEALVEERVDRPVRELIGLLETTPADEEAAPVIARGFMGLVERRRELVLLLHDYWSLAVRDPELRGRLVERRRRLREALAAAIEARHRTLAVPLTMPAERIAEAHIALAEGLAQARLADPDGVPDDLFAEMSSLLYDGNLRRVEQGRGS